MKLPPRTSVCIAVIAGDTMCCPLAWTEQIDEKLNLQSRHKSSISQSSSSSVVLAALGGVFLSLCSKVPRDVRGTCGRLC